MSAFIIVTDGELSGQRFEVGDELTVGRENSDLTLPDGEASRHHAVLRAVAGGVEVEDLHSLNGTWVDGRRLESPTTLGDGATLRIGTTSMRVEVAAPEPSVTRVSPTPAAAPTTMHAAPAPPPPLAAAAPAPAAPFAPQSPAPRSRGVATRLWIPAALTFAIIIATAVALTLYFAAR